ncbi:hypothetical protein D1P53_005909 [Cryptococcus gattii VGV]|nr:hypothetical protein D1P53_005909 [Cryptococcus gattii VGV]
MSTRFGYIGLGNMGVPIVRNLAKYAAASGFPPISIWNRSSAKYALVKDAIPDAFYADNVEDVVKKSDIILSSLLDDKAAEDVFGKMFKATEGRDVIFVDQSSLKAVTSAKLAEQAKSVGATYIASPVFGRPPAAEASKLLIVLSGPANVKSEVKKHLIPTIGDRFVDVGEDVRLATALKSMGNMVLLGWIELLAEAFTLGDAVGLEPSVFNGFIQQLFPAPPLIAYSNLIAKGEFPSGSGFSVNGGLKDARNIMTLGADLGHPCPLPTIQRAHDNLERAKELGGSDQDWSALAVAVREQAGFSPYREGMNHGQGEKKI